MNKHIKIILFFVLALVLIIFLSNRLGKHFYVNLNTIYLTKHLFQNGSNITWLPKHLDCSNTSDRIYLSEVIKNNDISETLSSVDSHEFEEYGQEPSSSFSTPIYLVISQNDKESLSFRYSKEDVKPSLLFFAQGFVAFYNGNEEDAEVLWSQVPETASYFIAAGQGCSKSKEYKKAAENYRIALSINNSLTDLYDHMASAYGLAGEEDIAISVYDLGAKKAPTEYARLIFSGRASLLRGDPQNAINYFTQAWDLNPHLSEAPFRLGLTWFFVGKYEQASRQLAIAADMDPDNWQIHYYLGEVYKAQEKLNFAIREYIRAVELLSLIHI